MDIQSLRNCEKNVKKRCGSVTHRSISPKGIFPNSALCELCTHQTFDGNGRCLKNDEWFGLIALSQRLANQKRRSGLLARSESGVDFETKIACFYVHWIVLPLHLLCSNHYFYFLIICSGRVHLDLRGSLAVVWSYFLKLNGIVGHFCVSFDVLVEVLVTLNSGHLWIAGSQQSVSLW